MTPDVTDHGGPGRGRTKGRGEERMVPKADFGSYYGRPIINAPVWRSPEIPGYLFLGGLAGGSSLLAAGAHLTGRTTLTDRTKVAALVAIAGSGAALVKDLGRPERFLHMLRVFKPSSPMSVGSWLLAAYGPAAGVAALSALTGRVPRLGGAATAGAALLGPAVASYTAALVADTAVPAWHDAHRELPFAFVGSAGVAAGGLGLAVASLDDAGPARRMATLGWIAETISTEVMTRRLGTVGEPYRKESAGRYLKAAKVLAAVGIAGAHLRRGSRVGNLASGLALVAASACTRFGIFHAGVASAKDPRYTVVPQRERLSGS